MDTRIALITGGNRGLGRAAALALAADRADVIITYRSNADEAQAVAEEIRATGRTAGVSTSTRVPQRVSLSSTGSWVSCLRKTGAAPCWTTW